MTISINLKNKFLEYKNTLFESKKYILLYLIFISLTCLSTISKNNIIHPKFELLTFIIVIFIGIFCISYYFSHKSYNELYKSAFVIILCFGVMCSLIVPISDVSDEAEHLVRAEITSQGILMPHWTGEDKGLISSVYIMPNNQKEYYPNIGYETIKSMIFFNKFRERTVFETNNDTQKIDSAPLIERSAFEQNPFYGYLPQALGIALAKFLDLNVIWILWLARICNLIIYASLISIAIKKTPYLKIPLLVVACIPITIYQASSVNIDSMIFGLGIITVSYFIYMCKTNELTIKNIIIFTILSLLLGLCKLPYLAFIFLLLFIPKENFKENNKIFIYFLLSIIFVSIMGLLWGKYATPTLLHSWRAYEVNANSTQQINFLINHPNNILLFINQILNSDLQFVLNGFFNFFNGTPGIHYNDNYHFITISLQIFLTFILFAYPKNVKFTLKTKLGTLGVILLIYVGTCFIQLLTWSDVGKINLGISTRYFIPLLALFPIVSPNSLSLKGTRNFDNYILVFIIGFMATLILAFATKYY